MFQVGVHFGYSRSHRHPKMKSFIFLNRNDTDIFDLEKTQDKLSRAKEFLKSLAQEKKTILFVGTKKEAQEVIEKSAKDLNMPYVRERWLGGTLTNFKEIKDRIDYLNDLLEKRDSGELEKYTKKERLQIVKKIRKLEKYLKGLQPCKNLPAALVVIDSNKEKIAIKEAKVMHIPVVAIMNSDCNPEEVDYPIPANDSSIASINYLLEELVKAYKEGVTSNA